MVASSQASAVAAAAHSYTRRVLKSKALVVETTQQEGLRGFSESVAAVELHDDKGRRDMRHRRPPCGYVTLRTPEKITWQQEYPRPWQLTRVSAAAMCKEILWILTNLYIEFERSMCNITSRGCVWLYERLKPEKEEACWSKSWRVLENAAGLEDVFQTLRCSRHWHNTTVWAPEGRRRDDVGFWRSRTCWKREEFFFTKNRRVEKKGTSLWKYTRLIFSSSVYQDVDTDRNMARAVVVLVVLISRNRQPKFPDIIVKADLRTLTLARQSRSTESIRPSIRS